MVLKEQVQQQEQNGAYTASECFIARTLFGWLFPRHLKLHWQASIPRKFSTDNHRFMDCEWNWLCEHRSTWTWGRSHRHRGVTARLAVLHLPHAHANSWPTESPSATNLDRQRAAGPLSLSLSLSRARFNLIQDLLTCKNLSTSLHLRRAR